MYLHELEILSNSIGQFLNEMYSASKHFNKPSNFNDTNLEAFYMDIIICHRSIVHELEALHDQSGNNKQGYIQQAQQIYKNECEMDQQIENMEPNTQNIQRHKKNQLYEKVTKSMPKVTKNRSPEIIKFKYHSQWLKSTRFQQIMENIKSLLKYQNKQEILEKQFEVTRNIHDSINKQNHPNSPIDPLTSQRFISEITSVLKQCRDTYEELHTELKNLEGQKDANSCSSSNTNRSLLTEILNKSHNHTTQTHKKKQTTEEEEWPILESSPSIQNQIPQRIQSGPQRLIVKQLDFESYQISAKPKEKKVKKNINYGQCSKCTIF